MALEQAMASAGSAQPSVTELRTRQVEALEAPEDVGAESRKEHVLFEMMFVNLALELLLQLAFAQDDEPRVGHFARSRAARHR